MKKTLLFLLVIAVFTACAIATLNTPEKKALALRETFNQGLTEYIVMRPSLPDEKTMVADELFKVAAESLNVYEDMLDAGIEDQAALERFLEAKNRITELLGGLLWKLPSS